MKIDSIKNQTYSTYNPISFKNAASSDVVGSIAETQPLQDSFEKTNKTETVKSNPVIAFLGKIQKSVQSFIDVTPDPYYGDYIGLPY